MHISTCMRTSAPCIRTSAACKRTSVRAQAHQYVNANSTMHISNGHISFLHTYTNTQHPAHVYLHRAHQHRAYAHQQSTAHTNLSRAAGSLMGNTVLPTINNTPECRFKWLKWIWCKTSSAIMWKILLLLYLPRAHEASFTVRKLEPW